MCGLLVLAYSIKRWTLCQIVNPSVPRGTTRVEWIFSRLLNFAAAKLNKNSATLVESTAIFLNLKYFFRKFKLYYRWIMLSTPLCCLQFIFILIDLKNCIFWFVQCRSFRSSCTRSGTRTRAACRSPRPHRSPPPQLRRRWPTWTTPLPGPGVRELYIFTSAPTNKLKVLAVSLIMRPQLNSRRVRFPLPIHGREPFSLRKIQKYFPCVWAGLNVTSTMSPAQEKKLQRHKDLIEETVAVGIMFASKAFVQLLANPIVGPLTHKYVRP